jgi:hypothetical protein
MEHLNKIWKNTIKLIAVIMAAIMVTGCYYDNEEYLYPQSATCNTDNMSFASDIKPVIDASCIGCHGGAAPSGNISLETYDDVAAAAAINPGNYGSLYGAVSHAPGNSPMPKSADKLPDCTIDQIKAWIDQGAMDN